MKISKKDALLWYEFFSELPEDEPLLPRQHEIALAALAQIEASVEQRRDALKKSIKNIKSLQGRTLYVGPEDRFPKGCRSCLLGTGLGAVRRTNKCNLACPFCYDYGCIDSIPPIGEDLWEIGGTKYHARDIDLLLNIQKPPSGVAYVYLEPFVEIGLYYDVIRRFHRAGVYQHMYTNGTLCTEENLKKLGEAGLDELRFNLGASNCADSVIASMAAAKKYIPMVGVETPMTPDFYQSFIRKRDAVLSSGIDFINCAELHLNANNINNYFGAPMYMSRLGYHSPAWSREITFKIMREASEEHWPVVIHDCSNDTKFARDLNLRAHEGGWFGSSSYGSEFDRIPFAAFLPILRDPDYPFVTEEPLPEGYRPGDIVL